MGIELSAEEIKQEWLTCQSSAAYFICNYVQIYDATAKKWIPFDLWQEQYDTLIELQKNLLVIILKARQLGLTWLCLAYILWQMLFHPLVTSLLFSRRDDEAVHLLDYRLKNMYQRLPKWMYVKGFKKDSGHSWELSNGSAAMAFPTSAGDSYTASIVLVDEADLVPNLDALLGAVKPTIDAGGTLILLSRSNKDKPNSPFKNVYRAALQRENGWTPIFLPWAVRPTRDAAWYDAQRRDIVSRTGSLDDLHGQYPATDKEALAPRVMDKRISPEWLLQSYVELKGVEVSQDFILADAPAIPGLMIFKAPVRTRKYVIGADPAEGNPTSNASALTVLDEASGEEVASLSGRLQPSTFADHINVVGRFYNEAAVMVERNNHGHAVLLWLGEYSKLSLLGSDHYFEPKKKNKKPGWLNNTRGKTLLYDECADAFRDKNTVVHRFETFVQLSSIEGSTLLAPEGMLDDLADAYALAILARIVAGSSRRSGAWLSH